MSQHSTGRRGLRGTVGKPGCCAFHPSREAQLRCHGCSRWLCDRCSRILQGQVYCSRGCQLRELQGRLVAALRRSLLLEIAPHRAILVVALSSALLLVVIGGHLAELIRQADGPTPGRAQAATSDQDRRLKGVITNDRAGDNRWQLEIEGPPDRAVLLVIDNQPHSLHQLGSTGYAEGIVIQLDAQKDDESSAGRERIEHRIRLALLPSGGVNVTLEPQPSPAATPPAALPTQAPTRAVPAPTDPPAPTARPTRVHGRSEEEVEAARELGRSLRTAHDLAREAASRVASALDRALDTARNDSRAARQTPAAGQMPSEPSEDQAQSAPRAPQSQSEGDPANRPGARPTSPALTPSESRGPDAAAELHTEPSQPLTDRLRTGSTGQRTDPGQADIESGQETAPERASQPPARQATPTSTAQARHQPSEKAGSNGPPILHLVSDAHSQLALTFDGGSSSNRTSELLDLLNELNLKVTMFLTGEFIQRDAALVRRALAEGHEIANHTWSHPHLTTYAENHRHNLLPNVTRAWFEQQLRRPEAAFFKATGQRMAPYWRAPFGEESRSLRRWALEIGYLHVRWSSVRGASLDSWDWVDDEHSSLYQDSGRMMERLLRFPRLEGGICLMHLASDRPHPPWRALPELVKRLRKRGIDPVTVSELLEASRLWRPWMEQARANHLRTWGPAPTPTPARPWLGVSADSGGAARN